MTPLYTTFTDRATIYRHAYESGSQVKHKLYENIPCGLSRTAHTHSPTPVGANNPYPQNRYRLKLYTAPHVELSLGDYAEISHGGKIFYGYCADSFSYDTHSVCVVTVEGTK